MVVRSNIMAVNSQRQLGMNNNQVSKALEKLSSGYRINRAGDDASGLAISEKMKSQIKGLDTASLNAQDGISVVQTAEGALTEVHNMLNRMTELATRSANGINADLNRESLQQEVDKLKEEIDRISESTNFNGIKLLDGSMATGVGSTKVQSGLAGAAMSSVSATGGAAQSQAASTYKSTGLTASDSSTVSIKYMNAQGSINTITVSVTDGTKLDAEVQAAIKANKDFKDQALTLAAGSIGFAMKDKGETHMKILEITQTVNDVAVSPTETTVGAVTAGQNEVFEIDTTKVTDASKKNYFEIDGQKFQIVKDGNEADLGYTALYTQDGTATTKDAVSRIASQLREKGFDVKTDSTGLKLNFSKGDGSAASGGLTLQIGDTADHYNKINVGVKDMSCKGLGIASLDISTRPGAADAIDTIRNAIDKVSEQRGVLGATQNRLEYTINNLDTASENLQSANSRIRDTDMAKMMMEYTKVNVLTQSAQAMLAQANQQPQSVLQLLQ
ncbi:hypothetical protein D1157_05400 [Anaerotruncus sp. X29]|nr:hypothetical protein [Anaerotruncus sp. X29]